MKVPVNHEILKWAREELNLSYNEVAARMKKSESVILAWENGDDQPTYAQLEKLAYEIYKLPLAVFFFPEHPDIGNIQRSFRTIPDSEYNMLPTQIIKLFRKGETYKENLKELYDNKNYNYEKNIDTLIKNKNNYKMLQIKLREILGIPLEKQKEFQNSKIAFEKWRDAIEKLGIYVFKDAFKEDAFSGFCLYDEEFPIIYINNTMPINRQIFTLFHEIYHIIFKTSGIDNRNEEKFINSLSGENQEIEIKCNMFAGDFLVPIDDFECEIKGKSITEKEITELAELYCVSREVILRKLYDKSLIDQFAYDEYSSKWIEEAKKNRNKKGGSGNYYNNLITYLGDNYLNKSFEKYNKGMITEYQLADYLNVKPNLIVPLENILMRRWING